MELYLIRHGQSANNALPEAERVEDPPLTELGNRQAALLADWIRSADLTRLYTSAFRRALETTEPVRQATRLTPQVWVDLHEIGGCYGGYDPGPYHGRPGMTREEIRAEFPSYVVNGDIDGSGWWKSRPFESRAAAVERAHQLLRRTREQFARSNERVAYVTHKNFAELAIGEWFEHSGNTTDDADTVYNTSVTKILITPDDVQLDWFNQVPHLPESLVTG